MMYQPVAERLYTDAQFNRDEMIWALFLVIGWLLFAAMVISIGVGR